MNPHPTPRGASGSLSRPATAALLSLLLLGVRPLYGTESACCPPPDGFVRVAEVVPDILLDIRYYSAYNFVGARVDGYEAPTAILTKEAAAALGRASDAFKARGLAIKIFDAYRPQVAVNHFMRWAVNPADTKTKREFYPDHDKRNLFRLGYISEKSGHTRGSTLDLTLVDRLSGRELDMGSPFDFFGEISHHGAGGLTPEQTANREILKSVMVANGFLYYPEEWWHYTLRNEPFPGTYFNFPVR